MFVNGLTPTSTRFILVWNSIPYVFLRRPFSSLYHSRRTQRALLLITLNNGTLTPSYSMGLVFFLTRPLHFISRERISAHITFCRIPVLRKTSWVFFWPQFGITIHLGFCSWLITAPASLSVVFGSCFLQLDARLSFISRSSLLADQLIACCSLLATRCSQGF